MTADSLYNTQTQKVTCLNKKKKKGFDYSHRLFLMVMPKCCYFLASRQAVLLIHFYIDIYEVPLVIFFLGTGRRTNFNQK